LVVKFDTSSAAYISPEASPATVRTQGASLDLGCRFIQSLENRRTNQERPKTTEPRALTFTERRAAERHEDSFRKSLSSSSSRMKAETETKTTAHDYVHRSFCSRGGPSRTLALSFLAFWAQ
jgi:hypothetical protein